MNTPIIECDFLVVGAGIAGASAAFELSQESRVVLIEKEEHPGYHSTGRSAAILTENQGHRVVRTLTAISRMFYENPPRDFTEVPLLSPRGMMHVARTDQRDLVNMMMAEAGKTNLHLLEMSAREAEQKVPVLSLQYVHNAVLEPGAMDLEVNAIHQGFLRGLKHNNGLLFTNAPLESLKRQGEYWIAKTPRENIKTKNIVNAAGAWSDEIAKLAGTRQIGLVPKRRTAFLFKPDGHQISLWPMVKDIGETFYLKPDAGRLLASPVDETPVPPHDARPEELDIALGADRIQQATTLKVERIEKKWAGLRSFVHDKKPVIGFADDVPGFFWISGQGGFGIETAPAIAKLVHAIAFGRALPPEFVKRGLSFEDVSPSRLWEKI